MGGKEHTRRDLLSRGVRGAGAAACGGSLWAYALQREARATPYVLRPPGARDEKRFLATCIKCGQCVADCPYDTLSLADVGDPYPVGTPHFEPREQPCFMCKDMPCVAACPTGALDPELTEIEAADMGLAVLVDQENCLSYRGLRCEICYRACPLQGEAITVENHPRKVSKHALFVPIVHSDACTGCGLCEKSCPLPEATIKVMPRELAQGRLGDHYRFGWTVDTPITQEFAPAGVAPTESTGDLEAGLDYLNEAIP